MQLLALSINHAAAPLAVRERVVFPAERAGAALSSLRERLPALVAESALLSTCNRTELYCVVSEPHAALPRLLDWLAEESALPPGELSAHLCALSSKEAVRHAFRVACGLESMVLGESQILGQTKGAVRQARAAGAIGTFLNQLFQRAFEVAKEVRSRTGIGTSSISLGAAAVREARAVFPELADTRVLLVGAGEMMELAAAHFSAQQPRELVVANRTLERAGQLAQRFSARTLGLAEIGAQLGRFDIVVCGTASPHPVISRSMVERALAGRQHRRLLMIDLAVPRDIDAAVAALRQVTLCTLDELARSVQFAAASRQAGAAQAEAMIEARVGTFMRWLAGRNAVPLLCELDERAERFKREELERAGRLVARGDPIETVLASLAARLSNKFLHAPRRMLSSGSLATADARHLLEQWLAPPTRRSCAG